MELARYTDGDITGDNRILCLDPSKDALHLTFAELRKNDGATMDVDCDRARDVIPPICLATSITGSRGELTDLTRGYWKVLRCVGTWKCDKCDFRMRPVIRTLRKDSLQPRQGMNLSLFLIASFDSF